MRDSGFDAAKPSAWIAEGLLIYLPASAQEQLFTGIDSLAGPGSHVAVEDGAPMKPDDYEAAVEEERAATAAGDDRVFFQLVYNEQHAPATEWLGKHGLDTRSALRWPITCARSAARCPGRIPKPAR